MENKKYQGVCFWVKESGNYMTHGDGLSAEQVAYFQSLKMGDRMIMFPNNRKTSPRDFSFRLLKHEKREDSI